MTGANAGIGFEAARVLAARGAHVVLACRDAARAEAAMERIRADVPGAELSFLSLDLADLDQVKTAAGAALAGPRIDGLIDNAGVMIPPRTLTRQGRSEEHTSELQSLMRISYAVFCLKKKKKNKKEAKM